MNFVKVCKEGNVEGLEGGKGRRYLYNYHLKKIILQNENLRRQVLEEDTDGTL